MCICGLGSASTVSLRGTELDPGPVAMATTGTNHGWEAESRRELLMTAESGKGLWCRTRPCGALGDGKLWSARGVRSKEAVDEGERRTQVRACR